MIFISRYQTIVTGANNSKDSIIIEEDFQRVEKWAGISKMNFNRDKILHLGRKKKSKSQV